MAEYKINEYDKLESINILKDAFGLIKSLRYIDNNRLFIEQKSS